MRPGRRRLRIHIVNPFPFFQIEADSLTVARGGAAVAEGIAFTLPGGQRMDVRGANGSGKTTLLRALAGIAPAMAGTVTIRDAEEERTLRRGDSVWLGDRDALKPELTVEETLRFWATLPGAGGWETGLNAMALERYADTPVRALSRGWRRRAALARVVISRRALWLLDEPFAALDEDGQRRFGAAMAAHLEAGGAIIAARHAADAGPDADMTLELEA